MQPIDIILIVYGAAALFAALLYIPKLVQFLHCFFPPERRFAREKRRIALLIPARDESRVIGDLFDSILRQTYDRENFEVNVIVKRADDPTVEMAKKLGFSVFVVPEQTCKGRTDVQGRRARRVLPKHRERALAGLRRLLHRGCGRRARPRLCGTAQQRARYGP